MLPKVVHRVVGLAVVAPLLLGADVAQADSFTVAGCYGAATTFVCDTTIEFELPYDVELYDSTVPVCVGFCVDVPVVLARTTPNPMPRVCATTKDRNGQVTNSRCVDLRSPTFADCPATRPTGFIVQNGDGTTALTACFNLNDTIATVEQAVQTLFDRTAVFVDCAINTSPPTRCRF